MHISDGLLPAEIWVGGSVIAAGGLALSLRRFDDSRIPQLGVLTSLFFVASALRIPVPLGAGASLHFIFNGILGVVLGRLAFPCVLVALFFQYIFLAHGGLSTLGVNALTLGGGAAAAHLFFHAFVRDPHQLRVAYVAFLAGSGSVLVSAGLFVLVMYSGGKQLELVGMVIVLPHLFVAALEGVLTASTVKFIARVKPELIGWSGPAAASSARASPPGESRVPSRSSLEDGPPP